MRLALLLVAMLVGANARAMPRELVRDSSVEVPDSVAPDAADLLETPTVQLLVSRDSVSSRARLLRSVDHPSAAEAHLAGVWAAAVADASLSRRGGTKTATKTASSSRSLTATTSITRTPTKSVTATKSPKSPTPSASPSKSTRASKSPTASPSSSKAAASLSNSVSITNSPAPTPAASSSPAASGPSNSPSPTLAPSAQVTGTLQYYGGPVIQSIVVIPVFWNANAVAQSQLAAFYCALVAPNDYFGILTQYHTTSPQQNIGFGSCHTPYVASKPNTATTDAAVQAQLAAWFTSGVLPAPTADNNNYYPVHFPAAVRIDDGTGSLSCSTWCAYHSTFMYNGVYVFYGIVPECNCGPAGMAFSDNLQVTASHELAESVTDAGVGLAPNYASPLAWYAPGSTGGEVGDLCEAINQWASVPLGDGKNYVVQLLWSNLANACVA